MKYAALSFVFFALAHGAAAVNSAPAPVSFLPPAAITQAPLPKVVSAGTYHDAAGAAHPWSITQAHALQWEGQSYIPVGGIFTPLSWSSTATDDDWTADQQTLTAWKTHGVLDICLSAGEVGLTHVPSGRVQRVLDYLDANGFRYGLEIADFPKDPLVGYVIKPGVYRDPAPPAAGPARFGPIPGLSDAFYMLVSRHDGELDETGQAQVIGQDTALVNLQSAGPDDVLLLYPERLFLDGSPESRLPDLWQGYDEYRDRLLEYFRHVKLGPGFRFFLDPLAARLGLGGEIENVVPTTDGFRLDFQAWLGRKYQNNVDDLNQGWGIADRSSGSAIPDFTTAARSIPLWFGGRGVPAIYDPVGRVSYGINNKPLNNHYWNDLDAFRIELTRGYMNSVADALQKGVADVPVVYQWTGHNALFSNDRKVGGYDGLSLSAGDSDNVLNAGAYVYAQAEESPQTSWVLAGEMGGTPSRPAMFAAWDALRDIGARGFFLPSPSAEALDWLNAYAAGAQVSAAALAEAKPRILPYPSDLGLGLTAQRLPSGVWWLPSYRPGAAVTLGAALLGYVMPDPDGRLPTYVVWAPSGKTQQAQFGFPKDSQPLVTDAAGTALKIDKKGSAWIIPIGADPVLISHVRSLPLPLNAADDAEKEAQRLLVLADAQKIDTERLKQQLFYANNNPASDRDVSLRYEETEHVVSALTELLRPYAWIEGESASKYNTFDSLTPDPDASGGAYLSLDNVLTPPRSNPGSDDGGYRAEYSFSVNAPGRYTVWMAGSPLGTPNVSAFRYSIDGGVQNEVHGAPTEGAPYAGKFVWSNLGDVTLDSGSHTLTLVVLGPRSADGHYALAIDAFCLSRVPFHPDGPHQPPITTVSPPSAADKPKT